MSEPGPVQEITRLSRIVIIKGSFVSSRGSPLLPRTQSALTSRDSGNIRDSAGVPHSVNPHANLLQHSPTIHPIRIQTSCDIPPKNQHL
jgi:hypothetical protein